MVWPPVLIGGSIETQKGVFARVCRLSRIDPLLRVDPFRRHPLREHLSHRTIILRGTKKGDAMNGEPKKQEPEIMPPVPEVEPDRKEPEIPPDKDAPEKIGPILAEG